MRWRTVISNPVAITPTLQRTTRMQRQAAMQAAESQTALRDAVSRMQAGSPPIDLEQAKMAFEQRCSQCHSPVLVQANPPKTREAATMLVGRMVRNGLQASEDVSLVRYPGLASHPTHENAAKFMTGWGAMISFETVGSAERAQTICDRVEVIHHATSLGGVETTMERRASVPGQETIPPTLIRMSVGCEDIEDLSNDLAQAFAGAWWQARELGLVHEVVPDEQLEGRGARLAKALLEGGAQSQAAAKALIAHVARRPLDDALVEETARRIAEVRAGDEAREGLTAFLEKRKPDWAPD